MNTNKTKITKIEQPLVVALATKFLWDVLHTEHWNFLFQEMSMAPSSNGGFCYTSIRWWAGEQIKEDVFLVQFVEEKFADAITIGMRREHKEKEMPSWWPNSFQCDLTIWDKRKVPISGNERLIIPPTRVLSFSDWAREVTAKNKK